MRIHFKNLGPLKTGEIDLAKKINLFVGYNNSGKTYTSLLLWSLFDYDTTPYEFKKKQLDFKFPFENLPFIIDLTPEIISNAEEDFLSQVSSESITKTFNVPIEDELVRKFRLNFKGNEINAVKAHSEKHLFIIVNKERKSKSFSLVKEAGTLLVTFKEEESEKFSYDRFSFKELSEVYPDYTSYTITGNNDDNSLNRNLNRSVEKLIFTSFIGSSYLPFFLPANRTFFPAYYKYVYAAAKEDIDLLSGTRYISNDNGSNLPKNINPFTKPLNSLIKQMFDLGKQPKANDYYNDLLEELKGLIGGNIEYQTTAGLSPVEFKLLYKDKKELDMHLSSSSSNQLTTLFLYFKYWAAPKNNFLFIDEPEENLHPVNQIKLINILMKFANRNNNRILVTTHSPLMSEAVNSYMNIAYLKEKGNFSSENVKDITDDLDISFNLKGQDFGLYFFDGVTTKEYSANSYGVLFQEFKNVENRMRKISSLLKNQIYEAENDK